MGHLNSKEVELEVLISQQLRGMGEHLHVAVKDDKVTLSGIAETFSDKRAIEITVKGLIGERTVSNQIRVIPLSGMDFDNNRH